MNDQKIKSVTLALLLVILFPILDACEDISNNGSCSGSSTLYYDYTEVSFSLNQNEEKIDYVYFDLSPSSVEFIAGVKSRSGIFGSTLMAENLVVEPLYDITSVLVNKYASGEGTDAVDVSDIIERFDYSDGWVSLSELTFYEEGHVIQLRCPKSLDTTLYDLEISIEKSNGEFAVGALDGVEL